MMKYQENIAVETGCVPPKPPAMAELRTCPSCDCSAVYHHPITGRCNHYERCGCEGMPRELMCYELIERAA